MKLIVLMAASMVSCGFAPATAARADPLDNVRAQIVAHAPYKQWDLASGVPNRAIGRTPGAACEAISFLAADGVATGDTGALRAARDLSNWVIGLQNATARLAIPGGVPSTPDLPTPSNAYYYAIDAAFCGTAMLDMAQATGDPRYGVSADAFGSFILAMIRKQGPSGGAPCEFVVQVPSQAPALVCDRYVKLLVALPLLTRLERRHPGQGYAPAAVALRATLMPGLEGLWEYASAASGRPTWHRVRGPQQQPDMFVYGDTLAYALRGLFEYEGSSTDVRRLYARFAGMRGASPSVARYDGGIALAGYIDATRPGPDPFSAYYDIVTLGILHGVKRAVAPADFARADVLLKTHIAQTPAMPWRMDMGFRLDGKQGDISTLAAIGQALLVGRPPRPVG